MTFLGKRKTKEFAGSLRNQQVRLYNFGELLIENYLFLLFSLVTNYPTRTRNDSTNLTGRKLDEKNNITRLVYLCS